MLLLRSPGVYAPQEDSRLLRQALTGAAVPPGGRVLDVCTGTGIVALSAALLGARDVLAVDASFAAVAAARCNARLHGLAVQVRRGDFATALAEGPFDLVTANPPYVPSPGPPATRGRARAWDAGEDGRLHVDRLCALAPDLLAPGGTLLMVHSSLCGPLRTLTALRGAGLTAGVVARRTQPFGPVLTARAAWLERRGVLTPGQHEEELVVIRADRPATAG
jgi:release factor glutamine methyltransferase